MKPETPLTLPTGESSANLAGQTINLSYCSICTCRTSAEPTCPVHFPSPLGITTTSTSYMPDQWSAPERVEIFENGDSIEMIYKQTSQSNWKGTIYNPVANERVFKIVFSCIDGKWNKSEPIYGKIIPAEGEWYEFE